MSTYTNPYEFLEDVFEDLGDTFGEAALAWEAGDTHEFKLPDRSDAPLDVVDEDDVFVITIELPGYTRSDISVTTTDRLLTIVATHPSKFDDRIQTYVMHERTNEDVRRSIQLPESIDARHVRATLAHGVLTVTVPKVVATSELDAISVDIQ